MAGDISADLRRRISEGDYRPGDRLPRVDDLMEHYGIRSRSAIDRALRALEAEGLVTVVQGGGIFVRTRTVMYRDVLGGMVDEYRHALGEAPSGSLVGALTGTADVNVTTVYERVTADQDVADALECEAGEPLLERTFYFSTGREVWQLVRSYLPAAVARRAGLVAPESERPELGTMAHLVRAGILLSCADWRLDVRMPRIAEIISLRIGPGTPVQEWQRVLRSAAPERRAVELSISVVRSDHVGYVGRVVLDGGDPEQ